MFKLSESHIHGHGLIATEDIKKNTDIGCSHIGIGMLNDKVVAGEATDIGNFQNHSRINNCTNKIVGKNLHMFTIKDVKKGEELVVNFYDNKNICINIENSENWD